jgi:hypothetical protein
MQQTVPEGGAVMSRLVLLPTIVSIAAAACTDGVTPVVSDPVAIRIVSGNQQACSLGSNEACGWGRGLSPHLLIS